ncbi:DNA-directed RNA polymerase subunit N [Methanococcus voltae]|uniref:DNA-directed RNA polymerase subunit N n=1 Tax=Methanococcus voltae TaxID=2188 RepID=UPI001AE5F6DE|nr:DNA-directed RNA polymerase subunit N [Methanococcus voltae]MBP2143484.1 DNA-directed RNA polymerase subunit N [Methanococcus voltae]
MMFPVRCFSCGTVVSEVYEEYHERLSNGEKPDDILDDLQITKYCCRRMFASHRLQNEKDLFDDVMEYK